MNAFLWSGRVNSISISVVFFPSKDALYGFFYGTALTKYMRRKLCNSVSFQINPDFFSL